MLNRYLSERERERNERRESQTISEPQRLEFERERQAMWLAGQGYDTRVATSMVRKGRFIEFDLER